jgi:hypothetical protein
MFKQDFAVVFSSFFKKRGSTFYSIDAVLMGELVSKAFSCF